MKQPRHNLHLFLHQDLYHRVRIAALVERTTVTEAVIQGLELWLERVKRKQNPK